jgi:hypothetical protein
MEMGACDVNVVDRVRADRDKWRRRYYQMQCGRDYWKSRAHDLQRQLEKATAPKVNRFGHYLTEEDRLEARRLTFRDAKRRERAKA